MPGYNTTPIDASRDTRLVLYDPSRTPRAIIGDMLSYKCESRIFDQSTFELLAPSDSAIWTTQYNGATAASTKWANWSLDFWFRGVKKFSGPVVQGTIEEPGLLVHGVRPLAYANLKCCSWLTWLCSGRTIQTDTGGSWYRNNKPWDDIMRDLVRDQCVAGVVKTPSGYPSGRSRSNFGPFTVTVEADTGYADQGKFTIETGKPLFETLMELCTTPDNLDKNMLWPYMYETAPGVFQFRVLVGRGGGGYTRRIGADLTGSVVLSGGVGTVRRASLDFDHLKLMTVACVGGSGRGSARKRTWGDGGAALYNVWGTREDELTIPKNTDPAEREAEARRLLAESNQDTTCTWKVEVQEHEGAQYAVHYDDKDSVLLVLGSTGETKATMIIGADISATAPDPAQVQLVFGAYPKDPVRDAQRSGGGGKGGGRRAGGKPKSSDGDTECDPDQASGCWDELTGNAGTVEVDSYGDDLVIRSCTDMACTAPNIHVHVSEPAPGVDQAGISVVLHCESVQCVDGCWAPVLFDTQGGVEPREVRYVPVYKLRQPGDQRPGSPPAPS